MTKESHNLFDELLEDSPRDSIDDLISDPFNVSKNQPFEPTPIDQELANIPHVEVQSENMMNRLSKRRQEQAKELAEQIDETNMTGVISYGAYAQEKLSEFSRQMLNQTRLKDVGEVGDVLTDLMNQLQESDPSQLTADRNLFQRMFTKVKRSITETQTKYQKISQQLDQVAIRLEREKDELLEGNRVLEEAYQTNKDYFEALNIYIAAGEFKMDQLQNEVIPEVIERARASQNQMEVQKVQDLQQFITRLDKRVHDLRLVRQMTLQQAPQIRMIQDTNQALAEKIQVSIHTAIPLWENQVMLALTLLRQQKAVISQRQVSETTNQLITRNSEMLKQNAIDTAHESERGVIDLEALKTTQENLIETIQETLTIQEQGRLQRRQAEKELQAMETSLHDQLLEISEN